MGQPDDENDNPDKGHGEESYPMVTFDSGQKGDEVDEVKYTPQRKTEKSVIDIISNHAEKSSLSGVAFIHSSKYWVVKVIWTILLLAALCVMVYHLHELGKHFFKYEKQTQMSLTKSNIPFPAVTVCNVNVIRKSKMSMASKQLRDLVKTVDPSKLLEDLDDWVVEYENETIHVNEDGDIVDDYDDTKRRKRSVRRSRSAEKLTVKSRSTNFLDDFNTTGIDDHADYFDEDDYSGHVDDDSWEAQSQQASLDRLTKKLISLYMRENSTMRREMGHQIQDMLIQCSFNGRKCVQSNFTQVGSSTLGNCYTLQYDKFVSRESGPKHGLSLILNLESGEYIPGVTNSRGAQIVVHERRTVPFPDSEGIAVSAGMATTIGLRKVDIKRLGQPHGDCRGTGNFHQKYGMKYTSQACAQVCLMEQIRDKCGCYDEGKPIFFKRLKKKERKPMCQQKKGMMMCMADVKWTFSINHKTCHCYSPCRETVYRHTISSKPWPTRAFARLIAKSVCKEKPDSVLCDTKDMDIVELRENFVRVTLFFESLDYEQLIEEEDYTMFQFISDIGGTIGLYVGLSVLGGFEFLHLFIALLRHFLCRSFTPP